MKYIIEINDHAMSDPCSPPLYRAKNFKTLVFDAEGLSKLTPMIDVDDIRQAEDRGYDKGYDEGYEKGMREREGAYDSGRLFGYGEGYDDGHRDGIEEGKKTMKAIVGKNLKRILCGDLNEKKFKPEVDGFEACDDCKHSKCSAYEEPCSGCKHCHVDNYKPKG